MNLEKINIYRITHIGNISHILKYGITHKNSTNLNPNFKAIGDSSLINTRNNKSVNITNGGSKIIATITLGDYIPFYFGVKMPMLYVIQLGGNFVPDATNAEDIVYIACSVKKIYNLGYEFYFSDGHSTDILTTFYDKNKIDDINTILDWNSIKAPYWGGENNLEIKRKKQAEFLVKGDVSPDTIIGYACYNDKAHKKLISLGIDKGLIKIKPNIYY